MKGTRMDATLHLVSMNYHSNVVCTLTWDRRVNLNQLNKKGLAASDIVRQNERICLYISRIKSSNKPSTCCQLIRNIKLWYRLTITRKKYYIATQIKNYKKYLVQFRVLSTILIIYEVSKKRKKKSNWYNELFDT